MKQHEDIRGLQLTLGIYIVIFAMKLAVYFMSGVIALLAEALHTLSDIFVSGFLLVAAIYSRKEADQTHMFGYGRAQNVAALVAATLFISFTSFELYREAIPRLFRAEEATFEARSVPGVLDVHDLRAEYIWPGIVHAGMHIEVQRGLPIEEADRIADEVDKRVHQGIDAGYCVIRVDAAEPKKVDA